MTPFNFEHAFRFNEKRYVDFYGTLLSRRTRPLRRTIIVALGVAGLFWSYTVVPAIVILAAVALALFAPRLIPGTMAQRYRNTPFLQEELTYGVSDEAMWVSGPSIEARVTWRCLTMWDEKDGWLRLAGGGVPNLWFPVAKLKEAGVYDHIMALCRENAVRFGSREAQELGR